MKAKELLNKHLGAVLRMDDENVEFDWASGVLRVKGAVIRSEALDGILAPVTIRGGFIKDTIE